MANQIGIIGLGRMGMQIARRLHKRGFRVLAWNRSPKPRLKLKKFFNNSPLLPSWEKRGRGSSIATTIPELINSLEQSRLIWLMLPAHETNNFVNQLSRLLSKGDIVIDGSNSFYQDSIKRANKLARHKINYLDAGVSGGVWGEQNGFSLMVGGERKIFRKVEPVFKALAAISSPQPSPLSKRRGRKGEEFSYGLLGPAGSGHFVKMVHNGIEYGMMEAIAEGFAVLNKWNSKLDLAEVSRIWEKGSVVSSWLISLARDIFEKEDLRKVIGFVKHTGEGEWTIKVAKKMGVDVRVIEDSFKVRKESEKPRNQKLLRNKILALLRNRFGGHEVTKK